MSTFDFFADMNAIYRRDDLSATERHLAVVVLSFRNRQTGACNPPVISERVSAKTGQITESLVSRSGLCERAVRKTLAVLEAKKVFVRTPHQHAPADFFFAESAGAPCTTCTPAPDAGLHHVHPTLHHMQGSPAPRAPQPCTTCTQTAKEQQRNGKEEQRSSSAPPFDGDEPPFPSAELWPDLLTPDSENPAPPEEQAPKRKRTPSGGATEATDGGPAPVKKSVRAKPKTLCPFDLEDVCPAEWTDAFAAAFPSLSLEAEFRRFVGHHVAKGTAFANWKAAFRNWLSNAVSFQARDTARFGYHPAPTRNRPLQKEDMVYTDNF